jgi:hypothetical protein
MKQILLKGLNVVLVGCLFIASTALEAQTVDYGKSYINLSKITAGGGTMEPGDTLQIKATVVVKSGTLDSCGYFDNIPAGCAYIPSSLAIITNEGKIYKTFTDAAGDDCGRITGTAITINLGYNSAAGKQATAFRRGQIKNTDKPSFFGSTCILVVSYKIKIIASLNSQINLGGGSVTYKNGLTALVTYNFPADNVAIFSNYGLCANPVGANTLGTEFNGTFGAGKNKDRGSSANVPPSYSYARFAANAPNDYSYGISNNTSTSGLGYSISNAWQKPDLSATSHRVFQLWDIIGDHTAAVNPFLGNPPADTVVNNNGGYMLVINASYRIDSAFNQTITGLCPNTYYEFSLWIRNICSKCGCDSNGRGATGGIGYIPTAPGDSSGVKPNLTLAINGVDYYTTSDIPYTGLWVKKGFIYLTGPSQTTLTAMIRNNAPGGGGNDWAIDDIALANCPPNLAMLPSPNTTVCEGNTVDISSVVNSYFSNYIYWQWEISTDNGVTWANTGVSGTGTPVLTGGQWQYTATYPTFLATAGMNNNRYRIKVASTIANLNTAACAFTASTVITVLTTTCSILSNSKLRSFYGLLNNQYSSLLWTTSAENPGDYFTIEKSYDGSLFNKIGSMTTIGEQHGSSYIFKDPIPIGGLVYYRIKLNASSKFSYSNTITLSNNIPGLEIKILGNPFESSILLNAIAGKDGAITIVLMDSYGKIIRKQTHFLQTGFNRLAINDLNELATGTYILQASANGQNINRKVIKLNK